MCVIWIFPPYKQLPPLSTGSRGLKLGQQLAQLESYCHGIAPGACRHLGLSLGIPVQAVGLADVQRHSRLGRYG